MKGGWVGNYELQALIAAKDGGAAFHPEVVQIEDANIKDLKSEWDAGTVSGGSVETLPSGGARLLSTATSQIALNANDGTNVTRLTHIPTFDAVVVEWLGPNGPDREIHNLVARLDPRRDGGQPKTVSEWRAQLFRVTRVFSGGIEDGVEIVPSSREVTVAASGEVAADYTFNFQALSGGKYPVAGQPPQRDDVGFSYPMTLIRIIALTGDGEVADNVTWLGDSGETSQTDGSTYTATPYAVTALAGLGAEAVGGAAYKLLAGGAYPEFTLNRAGYTAATITFSGATDIDNLVGSGALVIVARGELPSDSTLTYEIWDGTSSWVECFDGDKIGEDNTAQGGADLSSIPTTGPWDIRVTLTPSTAADLNTPTVREFGIERTVSTWLTGAASLVGGHRQVEPVTLKGNIAEAELLIAKTGEQDFRDYGSDLLASNHIGQIHVRLWLASTVRTDLARSKWLLHSVWDVDDYTSGATHHRLVLVSPLRRLRVRIPPFVVTTGNDGERIAEEIPSTAGQIDDAYAEIIDGLVGLAGRLRGPGPDDATSNVQKLIKDSDAKDELDRLAYLSGGAIIESQGKIRFAKMMRDGPGADTPVAYFPLASLEAGELGPGYSTRTDEFFVRYNWNELKGEFDDERRYLNAVALDKLGGVGINTTQSLDDETAKWITTSTLADLVGNRVPYHFATGLMIWPLRSTYRHPALEPGDVVTVETTRFVGRAPLTDSEVRGRVSALAVITAVRDPWGTEFEVWVPSFDKIVPGTGTTAREGFPVPGTVIHADITQRSHTGDTSLTALETFQVPPLRHNGLNYAVRARAVFGKTGTAGTATVSINYGGSSGFSFTLAAGGNVSEAVELVFQATGIDTLKVTLVLPVQQWPIIFSSNPFTVDARENVTFDVQLANAADTALLQLSEVVWMGQAA